MEAGAESRMAKRMRWNRNAAFVMQDFDELLALEHPRGEIEAPDYFLVDAEYQEMAEVGVGFDSFEDRNLKSLGEFRVRSICFGIGWKEAMLGETNRVETMPTGRGELEILLGRDVGVGREVGVYVQIDDHGEDTVARLRFGESVANLDVIFEREDMRDQEDLRLHHDSISLGRHRAP